MYVAVRGGDLTALEVTATGHRRVWTLNVGPDDYASPTVGPDGTIYSASGDDLVAVRDLGGSGVQRWRFHARSLVEVSNAVAPDGTVILGTNDDRQFGVRPDGRIGWSYDKREYTYSSSVATPDGRAFFGDNQGRLTVLDARDGREVFRVQGDREPRTASIWTGPAVDALGQSAG